MRISAQTRARNETRIRAAMDRLLHGDIPTSGSCDIKTLAEQSGVDRTAFYGKRPYAHLRAEFETRLQRGTQEGNVPDTRAAQIGRLKAEVAALDQRLAQRDHTIAMLTAFKSQTICQLAAQHDEITQLRATIANPGNIRRLPTRPTTTGPVR